MSETPGLPPRSDAALDRLTLLLEPTRRRVLGVVASVTEGATRDEVADRLGIDRALATFHLERLLDGGLLEADGAPRPSTDRVPRRAAAGRGRRGRPAKRYRSRDLGVELSLPARDYRLAAELMAEALAGSGGRASLDEVARARGEAVGRSAARDRISGSPRSAAPLPGRVMDVLVDEGYAPRQADDGTVCLANCPFDAIARAHRDLICPANRAFLDGVLSGSRTEGYEALLEPDPGRCCVVLAPTARERGG